FQISLSGVRASTVFKPPQEFLGCGCVSLISSDYPATCIRVTPASTVGGSSTTGSVLLLPPEGVV
ncbi:hypothetical protein A2U01_0056205, partial [Trifolium medium]|nr:hypothetical protein [Trifolium medium]